MQIKDTYADYAVIERQIKAAHAERAMVVGTLLAEGGVALINGIRRITGGFSSGLAAERDRRAIEADAFLRRSVPRY